MSLVRFMLTVAIVLAVSAWPAHAAPIFYSTLSVTTTHGPSGATDSRSELVYSTDTLGPFEVELNGGIARGSVTDAVLRVSATTNGNGTSATAYAGFFDTLLLESSSLARGTEVQLAVTLLFTRVVSPNGVPAGSPCGSQAIAYAGIDGGPRAGSVLVQDSTCDSVDIDNPTASFTGFIGQEMTINAYLNAAVAGCCSPATADASQTLRFLLTPVGDFTYTTASGNSYLAPAPTPVPEPSTLMLLGSALAYVAFMRAAACQSMSARSPMKLTVWRRG